MTIDLDFISKQLERVLTEIGSMRDDMRVMQAILMRHDVSFGKQDENTASLLTELRAIHSQITRMNDRIRKVEGAQ